MKKLILIAICFIALQLSAQGNLQFNQVVNNSYTATLGTTQTTIGTITVPAGKVWKIESANYYFTQGTGNRIPGRGSGSYIAYIGDNLIWDGTNGLGHQDFFPIWLPSGTYDVSSRSPATYLVTVNFSAIEFNVVP